MNETLVVLNNALLLMCTSMYFGTGWSLVLFSFPGASSLTVDNYHPQFVPQVKAATRFFTYMTMVMIATSIIMLTAEWGEPLMWVPIVVLAGVLTATGLTMKFIVPYNKVMEAGITDPVVLKDTLSRWMRLNVIRVTLWTVQWLAMASWFVIEVVR
jgi:hypothetical protein